MPAPIREQILAVFAAALSGIVLAGLTVARNRTSPAQSYPSLNVIEGGQPSDNENHGFTRHLMGVTVEGFVQVAPGGGGNAGTLLNDLYGLTVKAALADSTLGGLATDVIEGDMTPEFDRGPETDAETASFKLGFTIDYFVAPSDPYSLGPA